MNTFVSRALAYFLCVGSVVSATGADVGTTMPKEHLALLKEHCHACHNADKKKGKFNIDDLKFSIEDIETAERWQKVLDALNAGEMPPEDEEPLPNEAKANFLDDLSNVMVEARKALSDQKGVITMRRLNRREYNNTLRELLGVEINVSELPSDSGSGNFDTVGSNLFMSANQFVQYLALGRKALDEAFEWHLAVAAEEAATEKRIERFEGEVISEEVAEHTAWQVDAQKRATKWAAGVEAAAAKPENAEIVAEIRKKSKDDNIFRRFWAEIPGAPSPESFGFESKENSSDKANSALRSYHLPYHKYYMEQPAIDTGMYLAMQNEHPSVVNNATFDFIFPWSWPIGEYIIRVRAAVTGDGSPDRRFIEFGVNPRNSQAKKSYEVTGTMDAPQIIEIPFTFTSGHKERLDRTLFVREKGVFDHYLQTRVLANQGREENDGIGRKFALWIDYIEIERLPKSDEPMPSGMAAIDVPLDDKAPAPELEKVKGTLQRFAKVAFRGREPSAKYLEGLVQKYETRLKNGEKPASALKETLAVVLSSPMFLYLAEPNLDAEHRPLSPQELATRLSYFIWGSPPDAELLAAAASGDLVKAEVLRQQTTRLLNDQRSEDLVHSFTYQWLGLDRLDFFQVDVVKHPRFHNTTKAAARDEIYETMKHLLRENDSITNLLKSDYAIIDATLAEYYGIEGVTGSGYRKVSLPEDSPRGGLLGMAAVSLMGGNGDETNPVERGTWVLRKLLNDPPPPAPANIPQIARLAGKVLTTEERLMAHQEEAQCASCHRKIDPIGLGLENFDAVGAWRTEDTFIVKDDDGKPVKDKQKTWTIDPSGTVYKGPSFKDYFELRDVIAGRKEDFARGFTESLGEYALGRPIGFSDGAMLDSVVAKVGKKDFAMREFVHALVSTKAFQSK